MLITLAIAVGALGLFVWNRLRVDVVGLLVVIALIVTGVLTPRVAISGFANEATITVALMLALSAGVLRTGAIDILGRTVGRLSRGSEIRMLGIVLLTIVPLSAFINNTAAVAILMPMILGVGRDAGIAPSRLLMPLSFGAQLGGTLTLVGTSTNLLVAGLALDIGIDRIGLFEITPAATLLTGAGLLYILTLGRWLTPRREVEEDVLESYQLRDYLTAAIVPASSPLVDSSIGASQFQENYGLRIVSIDRGGDTLIPSGATHLRAGDRLIIRGKTPDIARAHEETRLEIVGSSRDIDLNSDRIRLAEAIVPQRSDIVGRTVRELRFRQRYGTTVLAMQRMGAVPADPVPDVRLQSGDVLLLAGEANALTEIHAGGDLTLLGRVEIPAKRTGKIRFAVPILLCVIVLAATNVTTIFVAALLGVAAMIVTGCIRPDEIYEEIDWMVIVLLGTILSLGIAMEETGAADLLARGLLDATRPLGERGVLGALYLLTTALTSVISNNAAAVVLTPIAVETAAELGVSPLPFVIAVMFAASNAFMTPIGYQTNTFILGPGGYRFSDFVRVGGPLNLLLIVLATITIPWFFPF